MVRKRDVNRILNLSLRPILPLFFAGSMTGFPGLPAATIGAQVPSGLFVRAFVETCQAEIPGTITPTAPFPPIPQVVQSYSGAGLEAGSTPSQDAHHGQNDRGEGRLRNGYERDHQQGQSEIVPDDSRSDSDDDN